MAYEEEGYLDVFEQQYAPENVVFVVDLDKETNQPLTGSTASNRLEAVKEVLRNFCVIKGRMNPSHKWGIVALQKQMEWRCPLTSTVAKFCDAVNALYPSPEPCPPFELSRLCTVLDPQFVAEEQKRGIVTRLVLLYSRSSTIPNCSIAKGLPVPRVDLLYIHEKPDPALNCPQDVYNALTEAIDSWHQDLDFMSYIFEAHTARKLRVHMATLLAHPLQRMHQLQLPKPINLAKLTVTDGR